MSFFTVKSNGLDEIRTYVTGNCNRDNFEDKYISSIPVNYTSVIDYLIMSLMTFVRTNQKPYGL